MSLRRAAVRAVLSRSVVARGVQTVGQVGTTAAELIRSRRDPAQVARRRYQAAKRRLTWWGLAALIGVGCTVAIVLTVIGSGLTVLHIFELVMTLALTGWCGAGAVRSARDVRDRGRVVAALPPPQPSRRVVSSAAYTDLEQLSQYSDSLRALVGMIGTTGTADDRIILRTRREVLAAADEVEEHLRRQADELTGLQRAWRTAPQAAKDDLTTAAARLSAQVKQGVTDYGQLVAAASEAVSATGAVQVGSDRSGLLDSADRLRGLARGLAEVAAVGGTAGSPARSGRGGNLRR